MLLLRLRNGKKRTGLAKEVVTKNARKIQNKVCALSAEASDVVLRCFQADSGLSDKATAGGIQVLFWFSGSFYCKYSLYFNSKRAWCLFALYSDSCKYLELSVEITRPRLFLYPIESPAKRLSRYVIVT